MSDSANAHPFPKCTDRHKAPPMVAQGHAEFVAINGVDCILFETESDVAGLVPRHFHRLAMLYSRKQAATAAMEQSLLHQALTREL